jgi:hypothetical protein
MTIAEYFRRRRKLILAIRYTGVGLTLVLIVWVSHAYPSDAFYGLWALGPLAIGMVAGLILGAWLRCPSCHLNIRRSVLQAQDRDAPDHCPRCGAEFGQSMPGKD